MVKLFLAHCCAPQFRRLVFRRLFYGVFFSTVMCVSSSCSWWQVKEVAPNETTLVGIQLVNRSGVTETVSDPTRLVQFEKVDFTELQPYSKVLRVFGRDVKGRSHSILTSYHTNGQIWQWLEAWDGRAKGLFREWHPNGKLHIESTVIEGIADLDPQVQKSWVFDKRSVVWGEEGHLVAEFNYDRGILHGNVDYYHPNTRLAKVMPYTQGVLDGIMQSFDLSGSLEEEVPYTKGLRDGVARGYWGEGSLRYQERYEEDLLLEGTYKDSSGKEVSSIADGNGVRSDFASGHLYAMVEYKNGRPEGVVKKFHADGTLKKMYSVVNNRKHGEEWRYYSRVGEDKSFLPKLYLSWHEGAIQGMVKTWYENGQLESSREMQKNKKEGHSVAYYENGDLMLAEEYHDDVLKRGSYYKQGETEAVSRVEDGDGIVTIFSSEGAFVQRVRYEKGQPLVRNQ